MSRRLLLLLAGVLLVLGFTSCQLQDMTADASGELKFFQPLGGSEDCTATNTVTLCASKDGYAAGEVTLYEVGGAWYAEYTAYPSWVIKEIHFAIADAVTGIPQTKKANPIPGHFEYSFVFEVARTEYSFPIMLPPSSDGTYVVAAHAVVVKSSVDLDAFAVMLPESATMKAVNPATGGSSYWGITLSGALPGYYEGWCVDTDHYLNENTSYEVDLYSSYEDIPDADFAQEQYFDFVNYLVNRYHVGNVVEGEALTYSDIQVAIWTLIGEPIVSNGLGSWSQARVEAIVGDSLAHGEGYVPGCGEYIALILVPEGGTQPQIVVAQVTAALIPAPCYQEMEETAWGAACDPGIGQQFDGANWATYFTFKP